MDSIGRIPPRSLDTFGVAGLIDEKGKVFYCSLHSSRHVGKVSDLISARLLNEGLDELRLRALILFGTFEVFRSQADSPEEASRARLADPLVVECGVDEEKVALGMSFTTDASRFPRVKGLAARIAEGKPEGEFEALLAEIHSHADRTVLRAQPELKRVEIVALLGVPGKADAASLSRRAPVEVVVVAQAQAAQPPRVEAYVELGDLDYGELLRENAPSGKLARPSTGEVLVHGSAELEDAFKVRAEALLEDLAGRRAQPQSRSQKPSDDLIRVSGGKYSEHDETVYKVGRLASVRTDGGALRRAEDSDGPEASRPLATRAKERRGAVAAGDEARPVAGSLIQRILRKLKDSRKEEGEEESFEKVIAQVSDPNAAPVAEAGVSAAEGTQDAALAPALRPAKAGRASERAGSGLREGTETEGADEASGEGDSNAGHGLKGIVQKVKDAWKLKWGRGSEEEEDEEHDGDDETEAGSGDAAASGEPVEADGSAEAEPLGEERELSASRSTAKELLGKPLSSVAEIQAAANQLARDIQTGIERTIDRARSESLEFKEELANPKAKRWMDGLMSELVQEKAHLVDVSKKLNASIRQKELEFRNKEQLLKQELLRRDEQIKQKSSALARAKDQLSQALMAAERLKAQSAGAGEDAHLKQKYSFAQKMLNSSKQENAQLLAKVEELKGQLMNAQMSQTKRNQPSSADFAALQAKYDRAAKVAEDLKKEKALFAEKLNELKKERSAGSPEELKKKLEAANKMVTAAQRETERLYEKIEGMQQEQARLQGEINKANAELKAARAGRGANPSGGAPQPQPAPARSGATPGKPGGSKPPGSGRAA